MMKHIVRCTASRRVSYNIKYLAQRGYGKGVIKPVGKSTTNFYCDEIGRPDAFISIAN